MNSKQERLLCPLATVCPCLLCFLSILCLDETRCIAFPNGLRLNSRRGLAGFDAFPRIPESIQLKLQCFEDRKTVGFTTLHPFCRDSTRNYGLFSLELSCWTEPGWPSKGSCMGPEVALPTKTDGWEKQTIPTMSSPHEDRRFPGHPVGLVGSAW